MDKNFLKPLNRFRVLTFDCYGTLIDWETGIWDALQPLIMAGGRPDIHRRSALECFGALEGRLEAEHPSRPYPEILAGVHAGLAAEFGMTTTPGLDADFAWSLPQWPAFPDTAEALRYLKARYKLVILSNVDRDGFAASNRKLGVAFDAVYTAEDIGSYKPAAANFRYLLDHLQADLGLGKEDILHTAQSLYHDHVPARALGLATAWIDRQRLSETGNWGATARPDPLPSPDYLFHSMAEMAAAVAAKEGSAP